MTKQEMEDYQLILRYETPFVQMSFNMASNDLEESTKESYKMRVRGMQIVFQECFLQVETSILNDNIMYIISILEIFKLNANCILHQTNQERFEEAMTLT